MWNDKTGRSKPRIAQPVKSGPPVRFVAVPVTLAAPVPSSSAWWFIGALTDRQIVLEWVMASVASALGCRGFLRHGGPSNRTNQRSRHSHLDRRPHEPILGWLTRDLERTGLQLFPALGLILLFPQARNWERVNWRSLLARVPDGSLSRREVEMPIPDPPCRPSLSL